MTVSELLEKLELLAEDGFGDAEVRLAIQPNYPLQSHIAGVCVSDDVVDDDEEAELDRDTDDEEKIVWIAESSQVRDAPYAPRGIWDAVRW